MHISHIFHGRTAYAAQIYKKAAPGRPLGKKKNGVFAVIFMF
jgi:hypothetical protein